MSFLRAIEGDPRDRLSLPGGRMDSTFALKGPVVALPTPTGGTTFNRLSNEAAQL